MGTLNITFAAQYTEGTQPVTIGSASTPTQITFGDNLVVQKSVSVATGASASLLTLGSSGEIPSADAVIITANQAVGIQFEGASAANNSTFRLASGQFILFSNGQIYTYNAAGDFGTLTLVNVEAILGRNDSGSTAIFKVWAFT